MCFNSEIVYNTVVKSCITFGGQSKVRDILPMPPLDEPDHICMHLSHTARKVDLDVYSIEVSRKSSMKLLHAHWLIGSYYFMRNSLK